MGRRFYDLDVQTVLSSGDDPVDAMAARATRLGFTGFAVTDYVVEPEDVDRIAAAVAAAETELDVRVGAKIRPEDVSELKQMIRSIRDQVDVLVVHGGDAAVNRAACEDTRVDVLAHPEQDRTDPGMDHVMLQAARKNRVAVGVTLRGLLTTRGKQRAHRLTHIRRNLRLAQLIGAPVVVTSGARSVEMMRAPRELAAFPQLFGMDVGDAFKTVSELPVAILRRADEVRDESFVGPGVSEVEE